MANADRRISLSPREKKVLDLAAQGYTDSEVALQLEISVATVSTYWGRIRMKLGPHNRAELVARHVQERAECVFADLRRTNSELAERLRVVSENPDADYVTRLHREALANAADGIVLVTGRGVIETLNDSCAAMFGYSLRELEGRSINTLIPHRFHTGHDQFRADYLANPTKRMMGEHLATLGVRKDGSEFRVVATLAAFDVDGARYVVCGLRSMGLGVSGLVRGAEISRVG